jgi:hypothetical protein
LGAELPYNVLESGLDSLETSLHTLYNVLEWREQRRR